LRRFPLQPETLREYQRINVKSRTTSRAVRFRSPRRKRG
jgi:hypothetical protein